MLPAAQPTRPTGFLEREGKYERVWVRAAATALRRTAAGGGWVECGRQVANLRLFSRSIAVGIIAAAGGVTLHLAAAVALESGPTGYRTGWRRCSGRCWPCSGRCRPCSGGGGGRRRCFYRRLVGRRLVAVRIIITLSHITLGLAPAVGLIAGAARSWTDHGLYSRRRRPGCRCCCRRCCCCGGTHGNAAHSCVLIAARIADTLRLGVLTRSRTGGAVVGGGHVSGILVLWQPIRVGGGLQPRLGRGGVAPLLHDRLGHLPGIGLGARADLLRHIHAGLGWLELRHEAGHVLAGLAGLQAALFLRLLRGNRLGGLKAFLKEAHRFLFQKYYVLYVQYINVKGSTSTYII